MEYQVLRVHSLGYNHVVVAPSVLSNHISYRQRSGAALAQDLCSPLGWDVFVVILFCLHLYWTIFLHRVELFFHANSCEICEAEFHIFGRSVRRVQQQHRARCLAQAIGTRKAMSFLRLHFSNDNLNSILIWHVVCPERIRLETGGVDLSVTQCVFFFIDFCVPSLGAKPFLSLLSGPLLFVKQERLYLHFRESKKIGYGIIPKESSNKR